MHKEPCTYSDDDIHEESYMIDGQFILMDHARSVIQITNICQICGYDMSQLTTTGVSYDSKIGQGK